MTAALACPWLPFGGLNVERQRRSELGPPADALNPLRRKLTRSCLSHRQLGPRQDNATAPPIACGRSSQKRSDHNRAQDFKPKSARAYLPGNTLPLPISAPPGASRAKRIAGVARPTGRKRDQANGETSVVPRAAWRKAYQWNRERQVVALSTPSSRPKCDSYLLVLFRFEKADLEYVPGLLHQNFSSTVSACQKEVRPANEIRDQILRALPVMVFIEKRFRCKHGYACSAEQVLVNELVAFASDP